VEQHAAKHERRGRGSGRLGGYHYSNRVGGEIFSSGLVPAAGLLKARDQPKNEIMNGEAETPLKARKLDTIRNWAALVRDVGVILGFPILITIGMNLYVSVREQTESLESVSGLPLSY
jgi:hypothetical protein